MKVKLDKFERKIENEIEKYIPVSLEEKKRILKHAAKTKTISLRINENVLERIKEKASQEGLSYQTLISSVLYRYCTNSLLDREGVRSVINSLKKW